MINPFTQPRNLPQKNQPGHYRRGAIQVSVVLLIGVTGLAIGVTAARQQTQIEPSAESKIDIGATTNQPLSNQQRFDALNGSELEKLRNRQERFEQFPLPRQQHLQNLHEQWSAHSDREELLDTMKQYTQWLKSLKAEQRVQIKSVSGDKRIKLVFEIRREQAEAIFGVAGETQLPKEDVSVLFQWSREFLDSRKTEIVELFRARVSSGDGRRGGGRDGGGGGGGRGFESRPDMLFLILGRNNIDAVVSLIQEDDISRLSDQLSPEAVAIIDAQGKTSDKQKLIYRWIVTALEALMNPEVPQRDLEEFFDTEMTSEQRKRVEAMTPEFRLQAIRSFYFNRNRQRLAPGLFPSPNGPEFRPPRSLVPQDEVPQSIDKF